MNEKKLREQIKEMVTRLLNDEVIDLVREVCAGVVQEELNGPMTHCWIDFDDDSGKPTVLVGFGDHDNIEAPCREFVGPDLMLDPYVDLDLGEAQKEDVRLRIKNIKAFIAELQAGIERMEKQLP